MTAHVPPPIDARIAALEDELLGFLRRRVGADGEEVAQEVWLKVAAANPDCPDAASFRAFVYVVARRMLIDRYRRPTLSTVSMESALEPSAPGHAESSLAARQMAATVERTLGAMKPEIAEVFRLRTETGAAFKTIAAQQGCSLNTALGRMHQAVKRLKRALGEEGWT